MVRTRNKLIQPTSKDGITTLETIIPNEQISISGLLALSHLYLDITMKPEIFSLQELYF